MTYIPVIPGGGNVGWSFLSATRERQQTAFDGSAKIVNDSEYFKANIGDIASAEELVSDRRLLSVALGAFGLDDDINNRFFVRKILEEGTIDEDAFANRFADKRYFEMAKAFGFDLAPPNTVLSSFAEPVLEAYRTRQFEIAVGEQDEDLRMGMGFKRDLEGLGRRDLSENATWFTIMGTPPLRRVFETALGLPLQTGALDIDRQLDLFKDASLRVFGTSNAMSFVDPELQESLVRKFLLRSGLQSNGVGSGSASIALALLRQQQPFN